MCYMCKRSDLVLLQASEASERADFSIWALLPTVMFYVVLNRRQRNFELSVNHASCGCRCWREILE